MYETEANLILDGKGQALIKMELEHFGTQVVNLDGSYFLYWSDNIANHWAERFSQLSSAIARLAILVKCGDTENGGFYTSDNYEFESNFDKFAEGEIETC
jgi:hypothetical protein